MTSMLHIILLLATAAEAFVPQHLGLRNSRLMSPRSRATPKLKMAAEESEEPFATLVLLRHGQSEWNEANLFTGWADVPLTTLGKNEAAMGATQMWQEGLVFDIAFTSLLKRAQQTLNIALTIMGQEDVPVNEAWRLNERMYGALTGLDKKETVIKYGEPQVKEWRRSFTTPPPPIDLDSPYWPGNDNKYAHVSEDNLPRAECLLDTVERVLPYWHGHILPAVGRGKTVLVAAHGNTIRAMCKVLDDIGDEDITGLEIPTGIPLVYRLDKDMNVLPDPRAKGDLVRGYFLGDPEEIKKAQEKVANQSKVRYSEEKEEILEEKK